MMKVKNEKGVTLLILTITITVLLLITGITIANSQSQLAIKNVNNLYSDLDSISTKVSDYYLKNNSLPVLGGAYLKSSNALKLLCISNGEDENLINPNDDGEYYVIDLSKLDNLTLNYGRDYKKWDTSSTFQDYQDIYIINEVSHQIYYPSGIKYNGSIYYTKSTGAESVNKIENVETLSLNAGVKILSIKTNKTILDDEGNVVLNADAKFSIDSNYSKDKLSYFWSTSENETEMNFTSFSLDEDDSASLMSSSFKDTSVYYLYVKAVDEDGAENIVKQKVDFNAENNQED